MVPRPNASKDLFHLLAVVATVVAIATLYFARIVLIPFALALLFTFILTPVVKILERIHFWRIPWAHAAQWAGLWRSSSAK